MQQHEQIDFIKQVGQFVIEQTQKATAPLIARIEQLEKFVGDLPVPLNGKDGIDGKDGKDGKNGSDGADGTSIRLDDLIPHVASLVDAAISRLPLQRNCVGGFIDRGGCLHLTFSDGATLDLGQVVGKDGASVDMGLVRSQVSEYLATIEKPKDGKDGRDGKDGAGFDDMEMNYDGERALSFVFWAGDPAKHKCFNFTLPIPLYREVWRQKKYDAWDIAQRDGSLWIAMKETETMPGAKDSDWKLCTKRGNDGKQGPAGRAGKDGLPGRDGRDLTQLGPDGRKW